MKFPWSKRKGTQHYLELERRLDAILQPITPRPEFVAALRAQLVGEPQTKGLARNNWQTALALLGFVLGAYMLVINGVRVVLTLLSMVGLLQIKKQVEELPVKPSTPAF